jgi:SRSO17 transposase
VDQEEYETAAALMVEAGELAAQRRDELMGRVGRLFARREPFQQAGKYVQGLMSDLPRKNGWSLAEAAGDRSPDKTQRLLNHACWDHHAAMGAVRDFVVEHLADPHAGSDAVGAVAVLDETGQEKKGDATAGVKRQYVGCAGQVANAINVVYCTYATARGHAQVGARLYVPKEQAAKAVAGPLDTAPDEGPATAAIAAPVELPVASLGSAPGRAPRAGTAFRTKPQLAVDILTDPHAAGVLPPWVTADEVYGRDSGLRAFCEDRGVGYVLGVPCSHRVQLHARLKTRADKAVGMVPANGWTRSSCGPGSKGDRMYTWAWIATASHRHHLLVRRNLKDPTDQAYFYCHIPEPRLQTLRVLVTVAGMRWPVEEDFQVGKDQFGLDHSQVRLQHALVRHLALAMMALAICATTAAAMRARTSTLPPPPTAPDQEPPADPGLIPLTVAETRRLLNLLTGTMRSLAHRLHWAWWRRRHQARARWYHHRSRLQNELPSPKP